MVVLEFEGLHSIVSNLPSFMPLFEDDSDSDFDEFESDLDDSLPIFE